MMQDSVIDVHQLVKTYSEGLLFKKQFLALRGVSLQVQRGEVFGLLGPNGAGKTTLIKILLGILHASSGKAMVLGLEAGSRQARRKIGYLPENMAFPKHHTGLGALRFYARLAGLTEADIRQRESQLLELVGLTGRESEPVRKYSKGMRQRLGLAQAMMHDPDILIMDEPTDGLDPVGRSQIRGVIEALKQRGKTIFLNSHILQEVEMVCDRVAILAHGEVQCLGTMQELSKQFDNQRMLVRIELDGDPIAITTALEAYAIIEDLPPAHESTPLQRIRRTMQLELPSQQDLDNLVDRLRSFHISIEHLERQRAGLEEVFMNVVQRPNQPAHV